MKKLLAVAYWLSNKVIGTDYKVLALAALIVGLTVPSHAQVAPQPPVLIGNASKLNVNLPLNTGAMLIRDGSNGMYRAGGYVDPLGLSYGSVEYLELGVAQSWTADKGYPGIGVHVGIPAGTLINAAQQAVTGYDLVSLWKPLGTVSNWVRLNAGYQHLQEAPGAGGKKDIWYAGVDVNVPVSVVSGWLQTGL